MPRRVLCGLAKFGVDPSASTVQDGPGPVSEAFAEAVADGAPVRTCETIRQGALLEVGITPQPQKLHNIARDTYRNIRHLGIGWKVPLDVVHFTMEDGSDIGVHYLHPKKLLTYLVSAKSSAIHGGDPSAIEAFWDAFKYFHGDHEVYITHDADAMKRNIPVCIHGDEGRGKRRSQTTVVSFESVLGMKENASLCTKCIPYHADHAPDDLPTVHALAGELCCNLKGHSFLQHFPLFVLPGTWWKNCKTLTHNMLKHVAADFHDLFYNGFEVRGETWYATCVGAKGDLKWFSKICRLTRGFENKGQKQDLEQCHYCLAGRPGLPAEDLTSRPCWVPTCFTSRPWHEDDPPALDMVPFDISKPEFMYKHDIFHTLRLGIYRDFCGSVVFLFLKFGYFGPGNVDQKLEHAHGLFHLWQLANHKHASLRSFTKNLLMYKNAKSYPWFNVKGSDCFLLVKWIHTITIGILNDCNDESHRRPLHLVLATSKTAVEFYDMVSKHTMFLQRDCATKLVEKGRSFINGYSCLAETAFSLQLCLFALKPKIHFNRHLVLELEVQLSKGSPLVLNPLVWDCCQNEDFIGRVCKLGRKIDARILGHRILDNYLIKAGILYNREVERKKRRRN